MKVYTQCSKCGNAHFEFDEPAVALSAEKFGDVGYLEHCSGFKQDNLKKVFGKCNTIEDLAVAIYATFHNYPDEEPWELYHSNNHDKVVDRFREAAQMVYAIFEDGKVGSMYPSMGGARR